MKYTIYIEREQFPDPERYPDGIAWSSGILDENGELVDGEGDIETFARARQLALDALASFTDLSVESQKEL